MLRRAPSRPFAIKHPVRIAERAALVDVLSNGRLELGLARSGEAEWETFGVDPDSTRDQLREALHVIPRIWTGHGFKWESELLRVPERDFVPKPVQKPHPPLWQTVSNPQSCEMAGALGVGMLGSCVFIPVERIRPQVDDYERGLARCRPVGEFVNDQRAMFTVVIGDVDTCRRKLRGIALQGLDRLMCLMQFGPLPHEAAMRSIRLVGEHLVPEFHAEPQRQRADRGIQRSL